MTPASGPMFDAVVVGGGFYGAAIAVYLARQRHLARVLLVERESALLTRASYHNQARVHNGYHYPRSFTTAYRSRVNLPRFVSDWPAAVKKDFVKLYAIARRNSKVTSRQFERFCRDIGATIEPAPATLTRHFDQRFIENVYVVEEYAFDPTVLRAWAECELRESGVELRLETRALALSPLPNGGLVFTLAAAIGGECRVRAANVFNCTYSGLNQLGGSFGATRTGLKHELTEMALMDVPAPFKELGITVMDGPFFSLMPFPARGLHTLSHVRYTPHLQWEDAAGLDPYRRMHDYGRPSRADRMVRDVARYLPLVAQARHVDSLFEVKTVLQKNEGDDGRPILFERHAELPGCYSILGGKIDNIYDVLEKLEGETLLPASGIRESQT